MQKNIKRIISTVFIQFIEQKKAKLIKVEGSKDFASPASALFKDRKDKGRVLVTLNGEIEDADSDEILVELKNGNFHSQQNLLERKNSFNSIIYFRKKLL